MKAKIVGITVFDSVDSIVHGDTGTFQKRLWIPEMYNLTIMLNDGEVTAFITTPSIEDLYQVLSEVEIPDSLVKKALALVKAQQELNRMSHFIDLMTNW